MEEHSYFVHGIKGPSCRIEIIHILQYLPCETHAYYLLQGSSTLPLEVWSTADISQTCLTLVVLKTLSLIRCV